MHSDPQICAEWLARLLSTEPADRPRAESALCDLYAAAGLPPPKHFFWFDSPFAAAWAVALLTEPHDFLWQRIMQDLDRRKREREYIERARARLCQSAAQPEWKSLVALAGEPLSLSRMRPAAAPGAPPKSIHASVSIARFKLYEDLGTAFPSFDPNDEVTRIEHPMRAVIGGQEGWSIINPLLTTSFYSHYSFAMMARDEASGTGRPAAPILTAAWDVARSAGLWWPFTRSVVVADRPAEMHVNDKSLLHRGDGPAAIYRDGTRVWAWNGHAMRESWIMHPEDMSARDVKAFDASFRAYAAAHVGTQRPKAKPKPSAILKAALAAESEERIALLRKHNGGALPLFDRYVADEQANVWNELIALGPAVREDPYAADALAVAYETMRRVEANVRDVTARLWSLGYRYVSKQPHEPPGRAARKQIARLEKMVGGVPLSLRAFYELVGAVDWTGEHPSLAPADNTVAPDPLVVFSVEDALVQCKETFDDGAGTIMFAPDDLQKASTSGGPPYEIAVPDLAADGKVLNERHELYFVEYLRLVFRFGGFPGYDGVDRALPAELEGLRANLIPF